MRFSSLQHLAKATPKDFIEPWPLLNWLKNAAALDPNEGADWRTSLLPQPAKFTPLQEDRLILPCLCSMIPPKLEASVHSQLIFT
jgi:hypothetical protein